MRNWSRVTMPFSCRWGAGASGRGALFWTGGDDERGNPGASLWIYRPGEGRWSQGSHLPLAVSRHSCTLLGEELFCVGGRSLGGPTDAVQVYHILTNKWRLADPLPRPVWQHCATAWEDELLCLGGVREGKALDEVWGLHQSGSHWRPYPPLRIPRRGHSCQTLGDTVYCVGGSFTQGPGAAEPIERRDPITGVWERWGILPSPGWSGSTAPWGKGLLYAGFDQKQLRQLHLQGARCVPGPMLPQAIPGAQLFALDGRLLVTDGICLWQYRGTKNIL